VVDFPGDRATFTSRDSHHWILILGRPVGSCRTVHTNHNNPGWNAFSSLAVPSVKIQIYTAAQTVEIFPPHKHVNYIP